MVWEKILYLLLLICAGILAKRLCLVSDKVENDLSRLLVDLFWPSLILTSIAGKLTRPDILNNLALPLFAIITALTGGALGWLAVRALKFRDDSRKVFLYDSLINNFIYLVLPFASLYIPGKGPGFLAIHNIGMILTMWSLGVLILKGKSGRKETVRNVFSTGLISTLLAIVAVLTGANTRIPRLVFDVLGTLGSATLAVAMIIAGIKIHEQGTRALRFDRWNISLGVLRLVLIPAVLLGVSILLKHYFHFSREFLIIFNLVNVMPVSINSITLCLRFQVDPRPAAQAVVFNHLFCLATIPAWVLLIEKLII